jgi:hypothetical protein
MSLHKGTGPIIWSATSVERGNYHVATITPFTCTCGNPQDVIGTAFSEVLELFKSIVVWRTPKLKANA